MAYAYPTTVNLTSSSGMSNLLFYINQVTDFWAGRMIMIAVFIIFLMGYLRSKADDDFIGGLAVASYVTFVIGLLFWLINFLDGLSFSIIIGVTLIATVVLLFDKRGSG
jgi:uncharacterized membrane protein